MSSLLRIKPMSMLNQEASETGEHTLRRSLGALNLITLGIGAIIGAGIFVLTGTAAATAAGPAVSLSFVLAGITCTFAGLCYAEFASIIPIAGSAYTYGYATLGEFVAWIIGWDLGLEYGFGAATVASGWSGYFNSLLAQMHIHIPPQLTATPGTPLVFYQDQWMPLASLPVGISSMGLQHATGMVNLVAIMAIVIITTVLVIGIKESANLNTAIVIVKLAIVGIFICLGGYFLLLHPSLAMHNWHPFIPPSDGHGHFGLNGIALGAASVFFAYIGFDAVSTAAQEAKNPQKDMPIGILGSLAVCTVLYILVSTILTGLKNYKELDVAAPVALGIKVTGIGWGELLVNIGAVFGLGTVMLVMLLGQSRVFQVPHTLDFDDCGGGGCGHHARLPAHRSTLQAREHWHAAGLYHRVRGRLGAARTSPAHGAALQDAVRAAGPDSGHHLSVLSDDPSSRDYLGSDDRLAPGGAGDLLQLLDPSQQGAKAGQGGIGRLIRKLLPLGPVLN
jgi:APA family basic amino acid/polyamine antiporter